MTGPETPATPKTQALSMDDVVRRVEAEVTLDLEAGEVTVRGTRARHRERRDLLRELGTLLYTHFHVGHHLDDGLDVAAGRDEAYELGLSERLADRSIRRRLPLLGLDGEDVLVEHLGLRVRVPRADVVLDGTGGAELDLPLLSPSLSPGFALARGPQSPPSSEPLLRVYAAAVSRDDATETFVAVLDVLAGRRRWHAKVASQARLYPRSDAVTIYLHRDEVDAVDALVAAVGRRTHPAGQPRSLFTRALAPTVGCAWEPEQRAVSFGQHRARVAAQLVLARAEGSWRPGDTEAACLQRGIDPAQVWRNTASPTPDLLHRPVQADPAALAGAIHG
ncbi:T3SS effector HopA1 family protein [Nocardioides litoris]|uniref:T3SS effector HopA1 family protein n=1 Tax=Nocardioides litoris TaxID=1926648 RepID=UPI0011218099|nr:T3SS effector HopA1 family protein [Nocardioides litoris]